MNRTGKIGLAGLGLWLAAGQSAFALSQGSRSRTMQGYGRPRLRSGLHGAATRAARRVPRQGHPVSARMRHRRAQQGQWPRQHRGRSAEGTGAERGNRQAGRGIADGLRRAAAHHHRHHRDPRQRKARPGESFATAREADASPPAKASHLELARFYYKRGGARSKLGEIKEAVADAESALQNGHAAGDAHLLGRIEQFAGLQYSAAGDPKRALEIFQQQTRDTNTKGAKGFLFGAYHQISQFLIQTGDLAQAEAYLQRNRALIQEARTSGLPGWRTATPLKDNRWKALTNSTAQSFLRRAANTAKPRTSYRLAEQRKIASIKGILAAPDPPPESQIRLSADYMVIGQARMKAKQGRLAEAEADARRALLARLKDQGKYNPSTATFIGSLSAFWSSKAATRGRDADARRARHQPHARRRRRFANDRSRAVGPRHHSQPSAQAQGSHRRLCRNRQGDGQLGSAAPPDVRSQRLAHQFTLRGRTVRSRHCRGAGAAQARNRAGWREKLRHGAMRAPRSRSGYMMAHRDADAIREFQAAIPILMAGASENADDDNSARWPCAAIACKISSKSYITSARPGAERRRRWRGR